MTCVGNDGFCLIGKRETGGQKDKDGGDEEIAVMRTLKVINYR